MIFHKMERMLNYGFWTEMSKQMHVPQKKLHDYYHNMWSKLFCEDTNMHSTEIEELMMKHVQSSKLPQDVLKDLQSNNPTLTFHYQSVY